MVPIARGSTRKKTAPQETTQQQAGQVARIAGLPAEWAALPIILLGLLLYVLTVAPGVRYGDPGEFQIAAIVLGVGHPPGYPLWIILGHLFTYLPFGDPLFRVNLAAPVYAALALGFVYLIGLKLGLRWWIAAAATGFFALAPVFWGEATEPRAYSLHALQAALTIWLLLKWRDAPVKRWRRWLLGVGFVIGTSFANHGTTLMLVPGYVLFLLWNEWQSAFALRKPRSAEVLATIRHRVPDYLSMFVMFALGMTPYLLLVVRFLQGGGPYYWGEPKTWEEFFGILADKDFKHLIFGYPADQVPIQFLWGLDTLLQQFGWLGIGVGLLGWFSIWRRDKQIFWLLLLGGVFSFVFAVNYNSLVNIYYLIPGHMFWALAIGAALDMLFSAAVIRLRRLRPASDVRLAAALAGASAVVLVLLLLTILAGRYWTTGRQLENQPSVLAEQSLSTMPNLSIVYAGWDTTSVLRYYQIVEGRRRDITLFTGDPKDWEGHVRDFMCDGRAIYIGDYPPDSIAVRFNLEKQGLFRRVSFSDHEPNPCPVPPPTP